MVSVFRVAARPYNSLNQSGISMGVIMGVIRQT